MEEKENKEYLPPVIYPEGELIHADSMEYMKTLKDNSIKCVITDPPYIYGSMGSGSSSLKYLQKVRTGLNELSNGFNQKVFFEETARLMEKYHAFIFCSVKQIHGLIEEAINRNYFYNVLVWHKYNAVPFANGTWRSDLEYIIHIREKGAFFQGNAKLKSKIWRGAIVPNQYHPTMKPEQILRKFLLISTEPGDIVLDPFGGSFSLARAALLSGRRFLCIEKEQKYYEVSKDKFKEFHAKNKAVFTKGLNQAKLF